MKISFLLSSLGLSGGVQVVVEFANRLTARGHQIVLVAPRGTTAPEIQARLDPRITIVESRVALSAQMTPWRNIRLSLSLANAVPPSDLIVSTHTPTTVVGLLAAHLLRKGKLVWLFQDYAAMFAERPLEGWLLRHALKWHRLALTVSTYCQTELQPQAPGQAVNQAHKVVVVGEGLSDTELLQPVPLFERPVHPQATIFFLGDMRPRKGLADFLAAAALVQQEQPNIKLWIASKEESTFTSPVPYELIYRPSRAQLIDRYSTCDIFVSASWCEGFGLPPLEAMACGTPVVMTDSGGVREYAVTGFNCLLVPPQQPALLAAALLQLLDDKALALHLAHNGPPTAQRFTWDVAVTRLEAALATVLTADAR